MELLPIQQQAY
jgi:hypothetical protein